MKTTAKLFCGAVLLACAMSCSGASAPAKSAAGGADTTVASAMSEAGKAESAVIELAEGAKIVKGDKPVIIDFNASWCGPCRAFKPIYDSVAQKYAGKAVFYSVDVDTHGDLAAEYGVRAIPTIVTIATDGSVSTSTGFIEQAQFERMVSAVCPQ